MFFLKTLSIKLGQFLALYGAWGLLGISLLDSSFLPLPSLNDLLVIHLSSQHPERAALYALAATAGSIIGAYLIYGLARGGATFLWRRRPSAAMSRAHEWLERNEFATILVAAMLPPPAPLKVFLVAAGVLRVNALMFGVALLVGRILRFGTEAYLGARYGAQAEAYLKQNFGWASLAAAGVVILMAFVYRLVARGPAAPSPVEERRSSSSEG